MRYEVDPHNPGIVVTDFALSTDEHGQKMIKFSSTIALQHDSIFSPFKAREFDAAVRWAADSTLDGVELVISDYSDLPPPSLRKLRERLNSIGLVVSTISTGGAYHREGLSLTSVNEAIRNSAFRRICEHIDAAELLDSKVTIGLLRGVGSSTNLDEEKKWLADYILEVDAYASRRGVSVLLEAINRYEVKLLNSLSETVNFLEAMKEVKSVKVLWDVFHANIEDRAFCEEIDHFADFIGHVHIADNNRSFPGFGKFDFNKLFSCLSTKGFSGFVSFECLNVPDADAVRNGMQIFLREARESLHVKQKKGAPQNKASA